MKKRVLIYLCLVTLFTCGIEDENREEWSSK